MSEIKSETSYLTLWNKADDSGNRFIESWYLEAKADEQVEVFSSDDQVKECIDLGCGAGELLQFMSRRLRVRVAFDFSITMINLAKKLVYSSRPEFVCADCFEYLPHCTVPIWITSGALNQYLDQVRLIELLQIFAKNDSAESFYLFDCIDPIRYATLFSGSKYSSDDTYEGVKSIKSFLLNIYEFAKVSYKVNFISSTYKYEMLHFGYGHIPSLWYTIAKKYDFNIKIISSRYFEYRYHVILKKT
jgi:SAM-dependent methyltransferase